MKVAALIPARKESRRLPDKNWREVGGKPLWVHAIHHARHSGVCDMIAISSDDEKIHIADSQPPALIHINQPQFPQDYDVMRQVVEHADAELLRLGYDTDAICLLQPTSPLRTSADVANCIEILGQGSFDAVVSVTEGADDIAFQQRFAGRLERLPAVVRPNGAIYAVLTSVLREGGYWYGDHTFGYLMPKERSIDIDNELDLEMAQLAWAKLNGVQ